eukprot:365471-Chlamydomonas_euryale.AAC.21
MPSHSFVCGVLMECTHNYVLIRTLRNVLIRTMRNVLIRTLGNYVAGDCQSVQHSECDELGLDAFLTTFPASSLPFQRQRGGSRASTQNARRSARSQQPAAGDDPAGMPLIRSYGPERPRAWMPPARYLGRMTAEDPEHNLRL